MEDVIKDVEKASDEELKQAVSSLAEDTVGTPIDEMRLYVFEQMMSLLKDVPEKFEAIAVARLALIGSVTSLVQQNATLISLILHLCETFSVTVKVSVINNNKVYEQDIPIIQNQKYDLPTLQKAVIVLIAKINLIINEGSRHKVSLDNANSTIRSLTDNVVRLNGRIKDYVNLPSPPTIPSPFRLAYFYEKDGVRQARYIAKCPESGYKSTKNINNAIQWDDANKAAKRLLHLVQNYNDYPISNIHKYDIVALHTIPPAAKIDTEVQLALLQSRQRVEKNTGV